MADGQSMTVADVVAGVLAGEAGDFLREAVTLVARELGDAGRARADGGGDLG